MLWVRLRGLKALGFHFRRQHPIGPFIVDFVCLSAMLVVEVDGAQHFAGPIAAADQERDKTLRAMGYEVVRVTNAAVNVAADEVLDGIVESLKRLAPKVYEAGHRSVEDRLSAQVASFDKRLSERRPPPEIAKGDFGLPQGGGKG
jgi:very-short-patch-repair endonuclease